MNFHQFQERNALSLTVNNLQIELENATAKCDEESEAASSLRAQLQKALNDFTHLKTKYDQDINLRLGEYEEAKSVFILFLNNDDAIHLFYFKFIDYFL